MRVKIGKNTWTVQEANIYGLCEHSDRLISLQAGQRGKLRLDTLIHEVLHASRPDVSEADVAEIARDLTAALWQDGWRRKNG